jgi:WD40 repeat protein
MTTGHSEQFAGVSPSYENNPFPGLRPFEAHEHPIFFGRDGQSGQVIVKLGQRRFVAVVGTSGSGKSSLVRAGLLPDLNSGMMASAGSNWRVVLMRPGNDPIGYLAQGLMESFGKAEAEDHTFQAAMLQAILRRSDLGLIDAVRQMELPDGENLLIIADQFEELFRVNRDESDEKIENDKAAFVKLLLAASKETNLPIYVVLTMRSEYLGRCAQFRDLPEAINDSQYLIPRLTRDERREAIAGPVAVAGQEITPRLINRLLNDMGDDLDQLPILQHALMRIWYEWGGKNSEHKAQHRGDALDLCCYEAVGGWSQALSRHADRAFNEAKDRYGKRGEELVEKLFKCITERGVDNLEVRRPQTVSEISRAIGAEIPELTPVIDLFRRPRRSFLTPAINPDAGQRNELHSGSLIDISHESLIRVWGKLKRWVTDEARDAHTYQRLVENAGQYFDSDQDQEVLLRGTALNNALEWRDKAHPTAEWAVRYRPKDTATEAARADFELVMTFLNLSEAARTEREWLDRQAAEEKEKQRLREIMMTRRLRRVTVALSILFPIVLISALYNLQQLKVVSAQKIDVEGKRELVQQTLEKTEKLRKQAVKAEEVAREQAKIAEEQEEKAYKNAIESERQRKIAQTNLEEVKRQRKISDEKYAQFLGLKADREQRDNPDNINLSALLALESLQLKHTAEGDDALRTALALIPRRITYQKFPIEGSIVSLSADSKYLAITDNKGDTQILESGAGQPKARSLSHGGEVRKTIFSEDGKRLATIGQDESVRVWQVNTDPLVGIPIKPGEQVKKRPSVNYSLAAVAFNPRNASQLATAYGDTVQLWDAQTGRPVGAATIDSDQVHSIAFSHNGKYLAIGASATYVWEVAEGQKVGEPIPRNQSVPREVRAVALSPDGRYLVTSRSDSDPQVWDAKTGRRVQNLNGVAGQVDTLIFSPDGRSLACANNDSSSVTVSGINYSDGEITGNRITARLSQSGKVSAIAFSHDSKNLTTVDEFGLAQVWESSARIEIARLETPITRRPETRRLETRRKAIIFNTTGDRFGLVSENRVQVWDATTDRRCSGQPCSINLVYPKNETWEWDGAAFFSEGSQIATAGEIVRFWDLNTGQMIDQWTPEREVRKSVFSYDGKYLAQSLNGGLLQVWMVSNRQMIFKKDLEPADADREVFFSFSPDGEYLITAVQKKETLANRSKVAPSTQSYLLLQVWDIKNKAQIGKDKKIVKSDLNRFNTLIAVSPSGKYEAAVIDNKIKWWASDAVDEEHELPHSSFDYPFDLIFHPGGELLAIHTQHNGLEAWNFKDRLKVTHLTTGALGAVRGGDKCAFSPNGKYLAVTSDQAASLLLWGADKLKEEVCARLRGNLSLEEWEKYISADSSSYHPTCANLPVHPSFIDYGIKLGRDAKLPEAVKIFQKVKEWAPDLRIDPGAEARWHYASHTADVLLNQAFEQLNKGGDEKNDEWFSRPEWRSQLRQTVERYKQTLLVKTQPHKFDYRGEWPSNEAPSDQANVLNHICWYGALSGQAAEVVKACENAVALSPDEVAYRDSRGVARALTGDIEGAKKDFQAFVDRYYGVEAEERKAQRRQWIKELGIGKNPFTPNVLKLLFPQ